MFCFSTFDMNKLGKIHQLHCQSYVLKTNKDIAPQHCEVLQTFVRWGGGGSTFSSTIQTSASFCSFFAELLIFAHLRCITFKLGNLISTNFMALFPVMSTDFSTVGKCWKKKTWFHIHHLCMWKIEDKICKPWNTFDG